MVYVHWNIKKGDIVRIQDDSSPRPPVTYGVVISCAPFRDQLSLFPVVKVYSFGAGIEKEYYPYNLEIISTI